MIRNDYILRLIEQLVRLLARVLHLEDMRAYDEALRLLRQESERLVGLDGGMMEVLDADAIRRTLRLPEVALVAGRILEEMALIYEAQGDHHRSTATAVKTLDLYVGAMDADPEAVDAEYVSRMSGLADALEERELTWEDRRTLMRCHEKLGNFAKAEDALFDLLEEDFDRERTIADGCAFYDRLLKKSDEELVAGGLPRAEVLDGQKSLREMRG